METKDNKSFSYVLTWLGRYIFTLVDLRSDSDHLSTVDSISKGVEFKGVNVWILFFAIVIASVGLNVNSTAVIIGAMLVSPLMGPIIGMGLAVGVGDNELLKKSLKNLFIMVVISLIASSLYFFISPLGEAQSELLSRTKPTIFDVFIAFFGGLAGIVAVSRKQAPFTVISGVAIATALMPPLCTAGYGIGTGQLLYSLGAFYLFFINSFCIAGATFIMVRYLKFPRKKFVDPKVERRVKRSIFIFTIIVIVPSVFMAIDVIRETAFNRSVLMYVANIEAEKLLGEDGQILQSKAIYDGGQKTIVLSIVGNIDDTHKQMLQAKLQTFDLNDVTLEIKQANAGAKFDVLSQSQFVQELLDRKEKQISVKDSIIESLKIRLAVAVGDEVLNPKNLAREMNIFYPNAKSVSIGKAVNVDTETLKNDTMYVVTIDWTSQPTTHDQEQINKWMKVKLNNSKVNVVHTEQ